MTTKKYEILISEDENVSTHKRFNQPFFILVILPYVIFHPCLRIVDGKPSRTGLKSLWLYVQAGVTR